VTSLKLKAFLTASFSCQCSSRFIKTFVNEVLNDTHTQLVITITAVPV